MTVTNAVAWLLLAGVVLFLQRRTSQRQSADRQLLQHLSRQNDQLEHELADCQESLKTNRQTLAELRREVGQGQQQLAAAQQQLAAAQQDRDTVRSRLTELETKATDPVNPEPAPASVAEPGARQILGSFQSPLVKDIMQRLADGATVQQIARDKGMQVGEVELIRALNKFAPKA